ncbi:MAG: hypothetical protein IKK21_03675, partial [Clostridia bacterium]|nr:hypothetical protein [Clostridia bacterium]
MRNVRTNPMITIRLLLALLLAVILCCPGVITAQAAGTAPLSDYAAIDASLYADASGTALPSYVEQGQPLFFRLVMSDFQSRELVTFLKDNSPVDLTVDISFADYISGSYPTEIYPEDYDNVAVHNGQALFRWWIQDGQIRIRFDDEWIRKATVNTVIDAAELGFAGTLTVLTKPEDGRLDFTAAGESLPLQLRTGYQLTKAASAPQYRNGQYEVDYTVTFTLDQDMNITGSADNAHYSALLTLRDAIAATNSALTGDIVGQPTLKGPVSGLTVAVTHHGDVNTFTPGGSSVLPMGVYTLKYAMLVDSQAAAARLSGYDKNNTIELMENGASLKVQGVETPLTATASTAWNAAISNRYKVDKCLVPVTSNSVVYRAGSNYYVDYYVVVYTRDEVSTFTVVDQVLSNVAQTPDLAVQLLGVNTAENFWSRNAVDGLPALASVDAAVSAPISGDNRTITVTAAGDQKLPAGAYYLKVPCKVTDAVLSLASTARQEVGENGETDASVSFTNKAVLESVNNDDNVNESTKNVTGTINAPASFIKRGAIEMDNTGNYVIYDKEGLRGKLIRWDVTFNWSVPNTATVITDTMKNGQVLLVNGSTSFDIHDMTDGEKNLVKLWSKTDTDYIDFGTDAAGNETFTFYPGRLSANPQDSTRKFKLTYYTLVPEDTVDFSPMANEWTIRYEDAVPGTGVGPIPGTDYPQLGEDVRLDLKKTWKYFVNDYVTQWLIEIKNPQKIPFDSLSKLIVVDLPSSTGKNAFANGEVWIDHDRMLTDLPLEIDVYAQNGQHERLTLGEHFTIRKTHPDYDLGTDGRGGFAIEFNLPAVKALMQKHRASFFTNIGITCYVHNADKATSNKKQWNVTNDAYMDYAVAGMELPDEDATSYTNREYSTISKAVGATVNQQDVIYHDYDGDGDKEVRWTVSIGANEFRNHPDPIAITVTDTLPAEMTLDGIAGDGWKTAFRVWAINDASGRAVIDLTAAKTNASFSYDETSNTFTLSFVKPGGDWARAMGATGTWVSCDIGVQYHTVFKSGALQAALDKAGSSSVSVSMPMTNSASVEWRGNIADTPAISGHAVVSDLVLDKSAKWLPSAGNKVAYSIDVNPYGLTFGTDGALLLQDAMGNGKAAFVYLENTFRLVNTETGMALQQGSTVSASSYILRFAEDGKSFTIDVPDSTPLRLTYQVKTTQPVGTQDVSLQNTASLEGRTVTPVEVTFDVNASYQSGSFSVEPDEVGIRLLKISSDDAESDTPAGLAGAAFTLTELDATGKPIGEPTTTLTDSNGLITLVEKITERKILLIEEAKAPTGYMLDAKPWQWCYVLVPEDAQAGTLPATLEAALDCGVTVINAGTYAEEVIPNEPVALSILKKNADGEVLTGAVFTLRNENGTLIDADPQTMAGVIRYSGLTSGTYTLEETAAPAGYILGSEHSWTIHIAADGTASLPDSLTYTLTSLSGQELTITNEPQRLSVQFSGNKALTGKALTADAFSFELLDSEGNVIETVKNAADGSFSFKALSYTLADAGQTYTYLVQEVPGSMAGVTYDKTVHTITVEITDNGDGTLSATASANATALAFTNEYAATGDVQFSGSKTLTGKALTADAFSFELLDSEGNVIEIVKNAADGSFSFSALNYTLADAGQTYTYLVQEIPGSMAGVTYDKTVHTITVEITDNGDGTLSATASANATALAFTNVFEASNEIVLTATKTVNQAVPGEDEAFRFVLADSSGVALQTVSNELGCITFAPLSYDQTDIGQTYTYTVYELEDERVCY